MLNDKIDQLVQELREQTAVMSSMNSMIDTPAYQSLLVIGPAALERLAFHLHEAGWAETMLFRHLANYYHSNYDIYLSGNHYTNVWDLADWSQLQGYFVKDMQQIRIRAKNTLQQIYQELQTYIGRI